MVFQPIIIHAYNIEEGEETIYVEIIYLSCFYGIMLFNETAKNNETIANAYSIISLFNNLANQFDVIQVQSPQIIEDNEKSKQSEKKN